MFRTTTHYKYWIFDDEDELYRRRQEANHRFIQDNITWLNVKVRKSKRFESILIDCVKTNSVYSQMKLINIF